MVFRWTPKGISPIGIDFGAGTLKLLQLQAGEPPKIVAAASAQVPDSARKDADAHHRFLAATLKTLLRDGGFKGKRVVVSIPAASTYIQHVRLPHGERTPMRERLETALNGRLPFEPSGMVMRHVAVGDFFTDGSAKQEVICFAASRNCVMRLVYTVRAAGFLVVGVHCEPVAILQSFAHLFQRATDASQATLFIDIGAATTKVLIAHGPRLVFAKTIRVGGNHFSTLLDREPLITTVPTTALLARGVRDEREPMPLGAGAPLAGNPTMSNLMPDLGSAATRPSCGIEPLPRDPGTRIETCSEMLEALTDELLLCLGYHAWVFEDRPVDKVVFLGGQSRDTPMCQHIARALRLPARVGNPLARFSGTEGFVTKDGLDLRQSQPGWAVPLGLCLLPEDS